MLHKVHFLAESNKFELTIFFVNSDLLNLA